MHISIKSNVDQVLSLAQRMSSQYPFAVAKALTDVAVVARKDLPVQADRDLDRPTPFTRMGYYAERADKQSLTAAVGVKDVQAEYLRFQVQGGVRAPRRKALRLPQAIDLDAHGNVPKGVIRQLVERARAGKRLGKRQAARVGVSANVDIFYGDPADGRPAGLYKRVDHGQRHALIPLVLFPARSAHYRKRFAFADHVRRVVKRELTPALRRAWASAMATARR